MPPETLQKSYILTGPTGSGKSQLAIEIAERLNAEIISMDSMALYRGMDIGTAKPSLGDRHGIPHHLIDAFDPWQSASVAWWLDQAETVARAIRERGRPVLVVGGTPLYLKALLYGIFDAPPADAQVRSRWIEQAQIEGATLLHARLREVDPVSAARLHANDLRRIVRALEVWEITGRPISAWQQQWNVPTPPTARVLCLDMPRTELYKRINARVTQMFARGFVEEVDKLRALPRPLSKEASQALGYREVLAMLGGVLSQDEAIERTQTRTRQFAKRQMTWFRNMPECTPATRELTFASWGLTIR